MLTNCDRTERPAPAHSAIINLKIAVVGSGTAECNFITTFNNVVQVLF